MAAAGNAAYIATRYGGNSRSGRSLPAGGPLRYKTGLTGDDMTALRQLGNVTIRSWLLALALLVAGAVFSASSVAAQSPPSTPDSVTVTRGDGTLSVSWPAVDGATSYNVNTSDNGKQSWSRAESGVSGTGTTLTGVANGSTYVVAVQAVNANGGGGWRNSAPAGPYTPPTPDPTPTPTPAPSPPATPASVTVTRADGTLTASGYAVSDAAKYHVTYSSDGGQSWTAASDNHTFDSITISGVDNAETYVVGVRAGNAAGWSGWRNSDSIGPYTPEPTPTPTPTPEPTPEPTPTPAPAPPDTPSSVTLTRGDGTVTASWPSVSGASKYHITYSANGKQTWTAASDNHTETSITITANNGKTYYVAVRAGNSAGWSGWRNSPASAPTTTPGIIVQDSSGNAITALSIPEGGEATYQVKLASEPDGYVEICIGLSVRDRNDGSITFKGEPTGTVAIKVPFTPENWDTAQTVTLVAAEDDDTVDGVRDVINDTRDFVEYFSGAVWLAVTEVDNDDPPAAPSSVSVTRADGTLTASWPPVSGATGYTVTYSAVGSGNWITAASNQAAASITISGLNNDHTYLVSASSRNKYGESPSKVSPPSGPYSKRPPATPLSVTVLRADGELTAFWNSGFGAESYHVTYTSDNGKNWTAAASDLPVGNGITEITIKSLDNAKTYTVGVRAYNKNGYSGWRNSSPNGPYVAIVAPPKPKNVKAYASDKAITFIWDKPVDLGDAEVTGYQAAYWLNPGACTAPETVQWYNIYGSNGDTVYHTVIGRHTNDQGQIVPGLKNGTKYGVALRAVNQDVPGPGVRGCGTPIAGVNPPPFVPPAPENLNLIRGDGTLTVTWLPSWSATGYQVDYSTDGGNTWKMAAWWNATTSIILSGMDNATTYTVKVRGRNDRGDGPWSDSVTDRPASTLTVSNLDETKIGTVALGRDSGAHTSQAAGFTTGANSGGYTLQSVTVKTEDTVGSPTGLTVAIHASSGVNPAASATCTLSGDNPSGAGEYTYYSVGTCSLDDGTQYFLVLSATVPETGNHYYYTELTQSDNETNWPVDAGWSIANAVKYNTGSGWSDSTSGSTIRFKVAARAR